MLGRILRRLDEVSEGAVLKKGGEAEAAHPQVSGLRGEAMLSPYENLPPERFWKSGVTEKRPGKTTAQEQREKRLAEALRANLKRRKAAAKGLPAAKQSPK